jgi:hypothetical protein
MRFKGDRVLIWIDLSGLASDEAANLVLFGKEGHLTNMTEQCTFSQKYLPFPPFERSAPHFGQLTIDFSSVKNGEDDDVYRGLFPTLTYYDNRKLAERLQTRKWKDGESPARSNRIPFGKD